MTVSNSSKKITKSVIDGLKPDQKDYFIWDTDINGFGIKITPTGRKVFVLQYRIAGVGNAKRKTIGVVGEIPLQLARDEAKDAAHAARKGIDPSAERNSAKKSKSISDLMDKFFEEHVEHRLKPSTIYNYQLMRRAHLEPAFGKLKLDSVTRDVIAHFHAKHRDEPYKANKLLAILSKFFNWCEEKGLIGQAINPCLHVKKFKEPPKERYLRSHEIHRLANILECAVERGLAQLPATNVIRLLMLTGARRDEILKLKWDFVDLTQHRLNLPDSKNGKKSIMLNDPAIALLQSIKRNSNPFVFPGKKPDAHLVNLKSSWQRIRKAADLEDVRLHDLRHTYASIAINNGVPIEVISKLLGHSQLKTTQRYTHLQAETLKKTTDLIADGLG